MEFSELMSKATAAAEAAEASPAQAAASEAPGTSSPEVDSGAAPSAGDASDAEPAEKPNDSSERKVTGGAWAKLQEKRRAIVAQQRALEEQRQAFEAERQKYDAQRAAHLKALESGDIDAAAKAAFGMSFSEATRRHLAAQQDIPPEVQRMQAELAELKKAQQEAREQRQQAEEHARRQAQVQAYKASLAEGLADHADPHVQKFAANPAFVEMIFAEQQRHYQEYGEEADLDDLVTGALDRQRKAFDYYRGIFAESDPESGGQSTSAVSAGGRARAEQGSGLPADGGAPRRRAATLTQSTAAEARPQRSEPLSIDQLVAKYGKLMREADA